MKKIIITLTLLLLLAGCNSRDLIGDSFNEVETYEKDIIALELRIKELESKDFLVVAYEINDSYAGIEWAFQGEVFQLIIENTADDMVTFKELRHQFSHQRDMDEYVLADYFDDEDFTDTNSYDTFEEGVLNLSEVIDWHELVELYYDISIEVEELN